MNPTKWRPLADALFPGYLDSFRPPPVPSGGIPLSMSETATRRRRWVPLGALLRPAYYYPVYIPVQNGVMLPTGVGMGAAALDLTTIPQYSTRELEKRNSRENCFSRVGTYLAAAVCN